MDGEKYYLGGRYAQYCIKCFCVSFGCLWLGDICKGQIKTAQKMGLVVIFSIFVGDIFTAWLPIADSQDSQVVCRDLDRPARNSNFNSTEHSLLQDPSNGGCEFYARNPVP